MKNKKNPDSKDDEKMNKHHIERWAPRLLLELMGLKHNLWTVSDEDKTTFLLWLREWEEKWEGYDSVAIARTLAGAGSDNHPYLVLGCLLWKSGYRNRKWLETLSLLFACQNNGIDPGQAFELACFGHSETHSTTYGHMPWAIALATKLFLVRETAHPSEVPKGWPSTARDFSATQIFLQNTATFWQFGTVPWPAENGRKNAKGGFFDNSPTVPACGERSTMAHAFMNPLGGLLAMAHGLDFKSNAMEWAGVIAAAGGAIKNTVDPGTWGNPREGAKILQQRGVRTWREICFAYWYSEGVTASWCPGPRLNGNTPDVKFSVAFTDTREVVVGFPWIGGRGDATKGVGGDCKVNFKGGEVSATGNLYKSSLPDDYRQPGGTKLVAGENGGDSLMLTCDLPDRLPDLLIRIDHNGVRIVS